MSKTDLKEGTTVWVKGTVIENDRDDLGHPIGVCISGFEVLWPDLEHIRPSAPSLEFIPTSERFPTEDDANRLGYVLATGGNHIWSGVIVPVGSVKEHWEYWFPLSVFTFPAEKETVTINGKTYDKSDVESRIAELKPLEGE